MPLSGSRFGQFIVGMIALSLTAIWLIFSGVAYHNYDAGMSEAARSASNTAILLAHDVARDLMNFDLVLKSRIMALADPKIMALPPGMLPGILFGQGLDGTGLGQGFVLDDKGMVRLGSPPSALPGLDLSSRDFFKAHLGTPAGDALFISRPFRAGTGGSDWFIALSRRIDSGARGFAGVAVITVKLSDILALFNSVTLPAGSVVALLDGQGAVVARKPFDASYVGTPSVAFPQIETREASAGTFAFVSGRDGTRRLLAYRRMTGFPFIQVVAFSIDVILEPFWTWTIILTLAFLALSALMVILGLTLRRELVRRSEAEHRLRELATTDGLTGLINRRRFDEILDIEWRRCARTQSPLSLLMIDVDYFKPFNDAFGHLRGDAALGVVAGVIKTAVSRAGDHAARFGGEEFAVLLAATPADGALGVAEAIRTRVMAANVVHSGSPFARMTVSVGVASWHPRQGEMALDLLAEADRALYEAKGLGRNTVVETGSAPRMIRAAR